MKSTLPRTMTDGLQPAPAIGQGFYQLTDGPGHHIHMYHKHLPWNADQTHFLYLHYTALDAPAELRVIDLETGETTTIGTAEHWSHHHAARQMWLPGQDRIIYKKDLRADQSVYAVTGLDGETEIFTTPVTISSVHRQDLFVGWLNDQGDRHKRAEFGLMGLHPVTLDVSLLCSLQRAIELLPDPGRVADLTMLCMQCMVHPRLPLIKFNISNGLKDGVDKHCSHLFVYHLETGETTYLGPFAHHPMWHPTEPKVVCFADDEQGRRRIAFLELGPDGKGHTSYLPHFSTTGHPSVNPDGRYVLADDYDQGEAAIALALIDLRTMAVRTLCRYPRTAFGSTATHTPGDKQAFAAANYSATPVFRTQAHPAWDRTGRYIAFNGDPSGHAHVYLADLAELGLWSPPPAQELPS